MTAPFIDPRLLQTLIAQMPSAPVQPRPVRPPSLFDRIADGRERLEQPQGLLSDPERSAMLQQGLLGAGASLLRSSGPSLDPISLAQAIGRAVPAGQAAAQAGLAQIQALQGRAQNQQIAVQRARIMERFAGAATDPDQLLQMFNDLVAIGDAEGARPVAAVLQSLISRQTGVRQPTSRLQAGVDPETDEPGFFRIGPEGEAVKVPGIEPIPRATTQPKEPRDLRTDIRVSRLQMRFIDLVRTMSEPGEVDLNDPNLDERIASGEVIMTQGGLRTKPAAPATVRRRAMAQVRQELDFLFSEDERGKLDEFTRDLIGDAEPEAAAEDFSADEIKQARELVEGLTRAAKETELRFVGYTADQIKRILSGR